MLGRTASSGRRGGGLHEYAALPEGAPARTSAKSRALLGKSHSFHRGAAAAAAGAAPPGIGSFSGLPKEASYGLESSDGLGTPESAPTTRIHTMSVLRAVIGPVVTVAFFLAVAACGVAALLPGSTMPAQELFGSPEAAVPVAVALLVLGLLGPCLCLRACIWWRSPSRSQRKHTAWFGDSLLQEMLDGRNIMEHLTVYGKEHAAEGTVIMLPGAAAPRGTLAPVASLVGERFRVICVDLPGQGSLSAVPYSLARCEMVLTLVVRRSQQSHPGRRVVIAAQGAAAYVACHFALRPASERLTAGLVVMGRVPDYVGVARCSCSHDAVFSLAWAAVFANRALKARVAASDWDPEHRRAASRSDFNMAVIPEMRSELQGRPLLHRLREFKRTVVFLGPRAWVEEAEELIPVRRVHARRVRGARDDTLPPVDGASVDAMVAEVVEYVAELPVEDWAMEDTAGDDVSIALSRPSFGRAYTAGGGGGGGGGSMASGSHSGTGTPAAGARATSDIARLLVR
ncbi:hypothetical protein FNF27_03521 [Cafeteria roenbergensis]|uniref:AB hydrolase-1 domain-containing protein n=2 Tax=Cafeteria roenbergensis TaxID=33653 RepID=A0A5A8EBU5_CAFRO|nr:hypothetical protein FNF27_03521 [Cafeteria roenbergensis]|mmetsp:Transcript_3064/g.12635  ORF Transcript_3064/g.12635 Transcript_3064/m.12635 type:complete len:514 (+) Transcript_3064:888-2429(+)